MTMAARCRVPVLVVVGACSLWLAGAGSAVAAASSPRAAPACAQDRGDARTHAPCRSPGKSSTTAGRTPPAQPDPGPGAVVWLDPKTMIYYCAEHPRFARTSNGYLIPEAHAKARGGRAFEGRSCS